MGSLKERVCSMKRSEWVTSLGNTNTNPRVRSTEKDRGNRCPRRPRCAQRYES